VWTSKTGTVSKATFANLESTKRYWFRVVVVGRNSQSITSLPVNTIVL
jgi:hypothetical protein